MSFQLVTIPNANHGANVSQDSSGGEGISDDHNHRRSFDNELLRKIEAARHDSSTLIQDYPRAEKLGWFSTACLMLNHTVGTGIFETPRTVWLGTRSVSGALFMWTLGSLITFSGLFVHLELGLTIPRYSVRGRWCSVPRSGGDKNYVGSPESNQDVFCPLL